MKTLKEILKWTSIAILALVVFSIAEVLVIRWKPVGRTRLMSIRESEYQNDKSFRHHYIWTPYNDISPYVIRAVIASEDNRFYEHSGFDWIEIDHAIQENKSRKRHRGASTITQQVAKNVFLWPESSWLRKGLEAYYTILIEFLWPKQRIMEVYLNVAEMGKGIYGIGAAAQKYFNKKARELKASEAALIAACLPNPIRRNPAYPEKYIWKRHLQILDLMDKLGPLR
jgi:monofunctional biosynthetic peptidoglycan transglycosylase